eukprot:9741493-Alexandrium_andersonii.AAC.1
MNTASIQPTEQGSRPQARQGIRTLVRMMHAAIHRPQKDEHRPCATQTHPRPEPHCNARETRTAQLTATARRRGRSALSLARLIEDPPPL